MPTALYCSPSFLDFPPSVNPFSSFFPSLVLPLSLFLPSLPPFLPPSFPPYLPLPPSPSPSPSLPPSLTPSLPRLQAQLAEKESDLKDTVSSLQKKHQAEIQRLKELLVTTETTNTDLQREVNQLIFTSVELRTPQSINRTHCAVPNYLIFVLRITTREVRTPH